MKAVLCEAFDGFRAPRARLSAVYAGWNDRVQSIALSLATKMNLLLSATFLARASLSSGTFLPRTLFKPRHMPTVQPSMLWRVELQRGRLSSSSALRFVTAFTCVARFLLQRAILHRLGHLSSVCSWAVRHVQWHVRGITLRHVEKTDDFRYISRLSSQSSTCLLWEVHLKLLWQTTPHQEGVLSWKLNRCRPMKIHGAIKTPDVHISSEHGGILTMKRISSSGTHTSIPDRIG
ncbi:hypothetical protein FPV67DRAFT_1222864 [Lyophyllum atratum]|nr:hypothetical protein FPV67DRAFT_1222864 [Lyophyllum atratum]